MAASGGTCLGRGVGLVRSGGRSVSWGGELGLWWLGLCRLVMEEKRETQREDGEDRADIFFFNLLQCTANDSGIL